MVGLDTAKESQGPRGYMVTNSCTFHGSASYPNIYMAGFSIDKIGNSSGVCANANSHDILLKEHCSELQTGTVPADQQQPARS